MTTTPTDRAIGLSAGRAALERGTRHTRLRAAREPVGGEGARARSDATPITPSAVALVTAFSVLSIHRVPMSSRADYRDDSPPSPTCSSRRPRTKTLVQAQRSHSIASAPEHD